MLSEEWSGRAWGNKIGWNTWSPKDLAHAGTFSRKWHIIHQNPWEDRTLWDTIPITNTALAQNEGLKMTTTRKSGDWGAVRKKKKWSGLQTDLSSEKSRPWGSKSLGTLGSKNIPKPSHVDPFCRDWKPMTWPLPMTASNPSSCRQGLALEVLRWIASGNKWQESEEKLILMGIQWFRNYRNMSMPVYALYTCIHTSTCI